MKKTQKQKVILIIRDGWGYRKSKKLNAVFQAKTPIDDELRRKYPWTIIKASQEAVGLPRGYQGNSEVGHLTIGSGRIINQSLVRINESIKDKSFFNKKELIGAIENCKKNKSKLHLMGLLQKQGVHAHMDHLFAILEICKNKKFKDVFIHVITDGRDSPPQKGKTYLKQLIEKINSLETGEIKTISGRYYAMDRDKRWQRTQKAYRAIIQGKSKEKFQDPIKKINECYKRKETDEFIVPTIKKNYSGVKDNDSIIFYNLRTDRPRQLTQAIVEKNFKGWKRKRKKVFFVAMTDYYKPMNAKVVFKEIEIKNTLGEILSKNNKKQLRISETEKYPHVTFFFNGQKEEKLKKEDRIIIPSPKVATYDEKPEMMARELGLKATKEILKNEYDFIVLNLVNADMVGHTGKRKAIIKAVESVDQAMGQVIEAAIEKEYVVLVFADHGNAEDQRKEWRTSHTINPVPFILISRKNKFKIKKNKGLKDIAPTVLSLMKIKKVKEIQGDSIINGVYLRKHY